MKNRTSLSALSKYGLIVFVLLIGGFIYYAHRHPHDEASAPAAPAAPAAAVPAAAPVLPELNGKTPVVTGQKVIYHLDVAVTAAGTQVISNDPNPSIVAATGQPITIVGWAVDQAHGKAAAGVAGVIDGKTKIAGSYGVARQDVATALGSPAYAPSAFTITIPPDALTPGKNVFSLLVLTADRTRFLAIPRNVTIDVK